MTLFRNTLILSVSCVALALSSAAFAKPVNLSADAAATDQSAAQDSTKASHKTAHKTAHKSKHAHKAKAQ